MVPDTEDCMSCFYFDYEWLFFVHKWKYRFMNRKCPRFSES
jgi:hypothetical protein